jgi:Aldo/keto reductase family
LITRAPFGSTGHESTRTIFGAAALSQVSHADAERTLELLLEHGVNHLDTAASYGDSELRIASWLKRHPKGFFVATKTDERDYKGAKEELHRSLERLGVDHVDLLQLHNLVDVIEWEFALREVHVRSMRRTRLLIRRPRGSDERGRSSEPNHAQAASGWAHDEEDVFREPSGERLEGDEGWRTRPRHLPEQGWRHAGCEDRRRGEPAESGEGAAGGRRLPDGMDL